MDDEELFRQIQSKKHPGSGQGVELVGGQDYRKEAIQLLQDIHFTPDRTDGERDFVESMYDRLRNPEWQPTQQQIFWLRDLRDKYDNNGKG